MFALAWTLARAGGWARSALLAGCTAVVSALLLVAVALVLLSDSADEQLASFVRDGGTRGGVVFAVLLLTLPPLLLLDQAVRLGSAHRDRRMAALRVAGATPAEVRRLGAIEVGIPASVGAVLGIGVFAVFRELLGGSRAYDPGTLYGSNFAVVPTTGAPYAWQVLVVVVVVAAAGTFVGWWATGAVVRAPLGVTRRETKRRPRPWGLLLIVLAAALTPVAISNSGATVVIFLVIALIVVALVTLAPWVAYVIARRLARRTDRAASLLAAQRIIAEPGAAGRAAAAVGGIALVGGGVVGFILDVRDIDDDSSYMSGAILVAASLLVGLLVAAGSMAVHSVESLMDRLREVAFLAASGMPESELELAARREITMVALPLAAIGSGLGGATLPVLSGEPLAETVFAVGLGVVLTVSLVWLASALAVRAVRPWAHRAASPLNLRTE